MVTERFGIDGNELSGAKSASRKLMNYTDCPLCNTQQLTHLLLALAVPLSRFTSRVGGGSTCYIRPHQTNDIMLDLRLLEKEGQPSLEKFICVILDQMLRDSAERVELSLEDSLPEARFQRPRIQLRLGFCNQTICGNTWFFPRRNKSQQATDAMIDQWPNQSPEPTPVGACRSAVAVRAASRRWLGFLR